ncbi:MAG: NnrT protein [Proteobacteria bacterium]|nr:NnrT protein [Pseudomonadota bacterium]
MNGSVWRLTLALFPFGWGAMAVNVFFASLIGSWVGLPVLGTLPSVALGALIALPGTWAFARHICQLMQRAEEGEE